MPKLRVLGGSELCKIFGTYGFVKVSQKGSHAKLRRLGSDEKETLTVPMHKEIDKGLLKEIFEQASQYVIETELRKHFYTD